jgi:VCBS repeat-containing protein
VLLATVVAGVGAPGGSGAVPSACPAGATKWTTATSGNWTDAARWSAGVPTATTPACIDLPGSYVVTVSSASSLAALSVFIGDPGAGTQPTLRNVRGVLAVGGDVAVHGRLEVAPGSGNSARVDAAGTIGIAPTGTLATGGLVGGTYEAAAIDNEGAISIPVVTNFRTSSFRNAGSLTITGQFGLRVSAEAAPPAVVFESGSVAATSEYDQTGGSLWVLGGTVAGNLDLNAPVSLDLQQPATGGTFDFLGLTGGGLSEVAGTIGANQSVNVGATSITVETAGLVNHGAITVTDAAGFGNTGALLRTKDGGTLVNHGTVTLQGMGFGALHGSIVNESSGLIRNAGNDANLYPAPLINRGTLRVATASLIVSAPSGAPPPQVVLAGGAVEAIGTWNQSGGTLDVQGGTVSGNPLDLRAPVTMTVAADTGGVFDLLAGSGNVSQLNGTIGANQAVNVGAVSITVETAGLVNHGAITVTDAAGFGNTGALLRTKDGGTLVNHGTVTLQGMGFGALHGSIVNESSGLIRNAGNDANLYPAPLINRGTLRAASPSLIVSAPSGAPPPHVVNDGTLDVIGTYTQTGGEFTHRGGDVTGTGGTAFNAVRFSGFGTWARTLGLAGASRLAPGLSPGTLEITGNYSPSSTTVTEIELGPQSDRVAVGGTAQFAGSPLAVSVAPGFVPEPCQSFEIFTFGARTGTFANSTTPIDLGNGIKLRQVYTANSLVLVAYAVNGVNVAPAEVEVSESGLTDTYEVCVGSGGSTVDVTPDDQLTVDPSTLVFATGGLPQTVTVRAVDDALSETTPHEGVITNGAGGPRVVAEIADNDLGAPLVADDAYAVDEDTPLVVAAPGVLENDSDPNEDPITAVLLTGPADGSVSLDPDGSFTYVPDRDSNGTDSFTYRATDGTLFSQPATVTIAVAPVNDAPVAADDAATTPQYTAVEIDVLANDADVDGDVVSIASVGAPAHGTATFDGRAVTYTPDHTFKASDSFEYTISDPSSLTATATVAIGELGCGEDGIEALDGTPLEGSASERIDRDVEPALGEHDAGAAKTVHEANCSAVVPLENLIGGL